MDRLWLKIALLWLTGVIAAAQLAKFSVLAPVLRGMFALDHVRVGLLISLLEVGGALFGFVAGMALGRLGSRRAVLCGLAILAGASLIEALATRPAPLFAARAVEGLGYLLTVIGAPTLIAALAGDGARRGRAMLLWSTFVPCGMGLGTMLTGLLADRLGARAAIGLSALPCLLAMAAILRLEAGPTPAGKRGWPALPAWLMALAFGCYTLFICALGALLPSFLIERQGASLAQASLAAGMVSLMSLPGSFLALPVLGRGPKIPCAALMLSAALAWPLYAATGVVPCVALAMALMMASGVARSMLFARLPALSGATAPGDPRIASAQGLLTQCGAGGALLGPPLGAWSVDLAGWGGLGLASAALMLLMAALYAAADSIGP